MDMEAFLREIDDVLGETPEGVPIYMVRRSEPAGDGVYYEKMTRFASAIERLAPAKSIYRSMADRVLKLHDPPKNTRQTMERLKAVLLALKEDVSERHLRTTEEIIHSDILTDFLEMAQRLVNDGFKDPAATIAGAVLAEHLRRLCMKFDIPMTTGYKGEQIPKKVGEMSEELLTAGVLEKADYRNVSAWDDTRKKALLGESGEFTREQVLNLISGLRDFVTRFPA